MDKLLVLLLTLLSILSSFTLSFNIFKLVQELIIPILNIKKNSLAYLLRALIKNW